MSARRVLGLCLLSGALSLAAFFAAAYAWLDRNLAFPGMKR